MTAQSREEELKKKRRRRLIQGLLMGSAAIGVPALMNALVSRRAKHLPAARWGSGDRYGWLHGDIAYQRLGDGPPLVLLHSFGPGHSAREWRDSAELLAAHHQVFAPDLLGWGASDKPSITYDGELYIRWLADFLRDVVRRPAAVVAAGLPSAYAVQVAADHPRLISSLAMVVPLGIDLHGDEPDLKDAIVHRLLRLPILGTAALNLFTSRSGISSYLRQEVYSSPEVVDDALVDEHYRTSHASGAQAALAAYLSGYLNHGVREVLPRLDLPVWVAWGRRCVTPAVETSDLWLRYLSNAQLEVLEQSGSLPHAESPSELSGKLELFLTRHQE